jgi:3-methyladenine DNA glycosylase AlkD
MDVDAILAELRALADPKAKAGMARFGITMERGLGVSVKKLRELGKSIGKDHETALALWDTGVHEARILASIIDDPKAVSEAQTEAWVRGFNSWDLCDQVVNNLFAKTQWAYAKAFAWAERDEEFVRRAGFTLMASLAVHDKNAPDEKITAFLPIIERHASDKRNFVKKAVNWALRNIGKKNAALNALALKTADRILAQDTKPARWTARDAIRELTSEKVTKRLGLD